jgi:hypothetical protein
VAAATITLSASEGAKSGKIWQDDESDSLEGRVDGVRRQDGSPNMNSAPDRQAIANRLALGMEDLCRHVLPHGRRVGDEWQAGWIGFRICLTIPKDEGSYCPIWDGRDPVVWVSTIDGRWHSRGPSAGDPVDLVVTTMNLAESDALEWGAAWLEQKELPLHPALLGLVRLLAEQAAMDAWNECSPL